MDDIFRYLHSISNVAALDKDEREIYEAALMRARDYNAQMKFAQNKALTEGRAEGRAEEQVKLVRNFFALKVPLATIVEATGLSEEEIMRIVN